MNTTISGMSRLFYKKVLRGCWLIGKEAFGRTPKAWMEIRFPESPGAMELWMCTIAQVQRCNVG
jgi:hypothetical protein